MENEIIHDILKNMNTTYTTKNELLTDGSVRTKIEQERKYHNNYSEAQLNSTITDLLEEIGLTYFTKTDVINAGKKLNIQNSIPNKKNYPVFSYFSDIFNGIITTILDLVDNFIVLFLSLCIISHLQVRSDYPTGLFYPNNESQFPYVHFNDKSKLQQSNLVSLAVNDDYTVGEHVFKNVDGIINKEGNFNKEKTYCSVNDPHFITSKCKSENNTSIPYFEEIINSENINFFAKSFMEANKEKTPNELTFYGLLTYVCAYSFCNSNGSMQLINDIFKPIFKMTFSDNPTVVHHILTLIVIYIFYIAFSQSKESAKKRVKKFYNNITEDISYGEYEDISYGGIKADTFLDFGVNYITSTISPFLFFFKLLFLILFPIVQFHCIFSYMNYSSYSSSFFLKLFCYLGIAWSLTMGITYFLDVIKILTNTQDCDNNVDSVFDTTITDVLTTIQSNITSFISEVEFLKDLVSAVDTNLSASYSTSQEESTESPTDEEIQAAADALEWGNPNANTYYKKLSEANEQKSTDAARTALCYDDTWWDPDGLRDRNGKKFGSQDKDGLPGYCRYLLKFGTKEGCPRFKNMEGGGDDRCHQNKKFPRFKRKKIGNNEYEYQMFDPYENWDPTGQQRYYEGFTTKSGIEGFIEGACGSKCKKIKKKKKKKKELEAAEEEEEDEVFEEEYGIDLGDDEDEDDSAWTQPTYNIPIANNFFSQNSSSFCNFSKIASALGADRPELNIFAFILITPFIIILTAIPLIVSLSFAFSTTKSIVIQFINYLESIFCKFSKSYMTVRFSVYFIMISYIVTMSKTLPDLFNKGETVISPTKAKTSIIFIIFLMLIDSIRMNHFWKNLCNLHKLFDFFGKKRNIITSGYWTNGESGKSDSRYGKTTSANGASGSAYGKRSSVNGKRSSVNGERDTENNSLVSQLMNAIKGSIKGDSDSSTKTNSLSNNLINIFKSMI
uniref:Uncharacterized protein n=1 Tax=viral metagenome TaxID=1070528 RepID=A0A6C0KMX3_9ZZZZ